jgi:hypothetical protein
MNRFHTLHGVGVRHFLDTYADPQVPADRVLTITYAVGGAGAQKEIGVGLLRAFRTRLLNGSMRLNLVAGTRQEVADHFHDNVHRVVGECEGVRVVYAPSMHDYLRDFHGVVRATDVLWTKPSELSFYAGLGLPIVMTPTIGPQERANRKWLTEIGAGMKQEKIEYADQWFIHQLENGRFAELAWMGFLRARKMGTYHIMDVIETGTFQRSDSPLQR